jgi:hypothetical protein
MTIFTGHGFCWALAECNSVNTINSKRENGRILNLVMDAPLKCLG